MTCISITWLSEKHFSQSMHFKFFSPVCNCYYIFRTLLYEKKLESQFLKYDLLHWLHWHIFSPLCAEICLLRFPLFQKALSQVLQWYDFHQYAFFHDMHSKTRNRCSLLCAIKCDFSCLIDQINLLTLSMIAVCYCWYATLGMQVYQPKCFMSYTTRIFHKKTLILLITFKWLLSSMCFLVTDKTHFLGKHLLH